MDDFLNKIPNWLRWVLYIPIPFLLGRIAVVAASIGTTLATGIDFSINSGSIIYSLLFFIYDNAITTVSIGVISYWIAPSKKFPAAMVQITIWLLFNAVLMGIFIMATLYNYGSSYLYDWESIKTYVGFVTVVVATVIVVRELIKSEEESKYISTELDQNDM